MVGICYHSPNARYSAAYEPSFARRKADKRSRKNLFRTALDKLTKNHKEKKATSENVYEVIVVYKDQHDHSEGKVKTKHTSPKTDNSHSDNEPPKAPPRTRSRPQSRNSSKSYEINNLPPTRPPRSRSQSRRSSIIRLETIPTPPPRSRPHSRNSCKGSRHKIHETSSYQPNLHNADKSDLCKPPIPPTSPTRKFRKQLAGKSKDQTKSIRKSVSLADLESGLDYIDIDDADETEPIRKSITRPSSKLYNSDEMFACNARMDSRWAVVKNSSNLSLHMPDSVKVQETYLGPEHSPGLIAEQRTQSYSGLAENQLDTSLVPENSLGQLAPMDRVKLSLGKLDIPDWYMARPNKVETVIACEQRTAWKKGSFPNLHNSTSKSKPCSPVPPSSPSQSPSNWRNKIRDKPIQQTSPTPSNPELPSSHRPYTGWRSQEKLPTFLSLGRSSRLEEERMKIKPLDAAAAAGDE